MDFSSYNLTCKLFYFICLSIMSYSVVYSTFPSKQEAICAANTIVNEKLAACANIIDNIESIFLWEGKVCNEKEVIVIFKTKNELFNKLKDRLSAIHYYDTPCIICLKIEDGDKKFLKWIESSVKIDIN